MKPRDPQTQDQEERIDRKARDLFEAFLDGRASLDIHPLPGNDGVAAQVGSASLLQGFSVRLRRDPD